MAFCPRKRVCGHRLRSPHRRCFCRREPGPEDAAANARESKRLGRVLAVVVHSTIEDFGAGFHLAFTAGAHIIDMEFTQFRDSPPGAARFGGRYLNSAGERFMEKYSPERLELSPRDVVSRAEATEIEEGRGYTGPGGLDYVNIDLRHHRLNE